MKYVVIGTSAGGIDALKTILPVFKRPSSCSVLVVIHLPPRGPNLIPTLFQDLTDFKIKEAESGEKAEPETIYIAAPNYHLSLEPNGTLSLSNEEHVHFSRPSIDILFDSAAHSMGNKVLGVLMTGANSDGASGLVKIKKFGGISVVQKPESAEYPVMPESALKLMKPDHVEDFEGIKKILNSYSHGANVDR
jgi:two-component system chemotaxis response regulator CheB